MSKVNLLLFVITLITTTTSETLSDAGGITIGIGIGTRGGGGNPDPEPGCDCPPPEPPPSCSPPPPPQLDFLNPLQAAAYIVIQRFKMTITADPLNKTGDWVGDRPCSYTGFFCSTPPDRPTTPTIASIDFNGFHLAAPTLAGFIDQLPDLALFHANSNNFSGTVPDLTNLQYLYELDLSNNKLSGPFPINLLPLSQLLFLDIRFNSFAGSVPGNIFSIDLDVLFLNNNGFSQPLPASLGTTTALYLTLANNRFTGPIPRSVCNASDTLLEVLFLNNRLSGCLPYEVGLLKEATVFDAGMNRITGPIPWSLGCLRSIEQLNLAGNLLYGDVPDVLCKLGVHGKLENLSLSDNYFTSVGYSCWELIREKKLDVRGNCIGGLPDQRPAWECAYFFSRPKLCPFVGFIPCIGHHLRGGESGDRDGANKAQSRSEPVTYKALNQRHG